MILDHYGRPAVASPSILSAMRESQSEGIKRAFDNSFMRCTTLYDHRGRIVDVPSQYPDKIGYKFECRIPVRFRSQA